MERILFAAIAGLACGHATPSGRSTGERPVDQLADIAGTWVAQDDMDFGYTLTIDARGAIDQVVDRGKLGVCEQKGDAARTAARTFHVVFARDECRRDPLTPGGSEVELAVASFTGDALVLAWGDARRAYRRAPQ